LARLTVAFAGLALPLFAVGSAQAAIAGANPESTSNRPDLISATALNATNVDFCFDKQLNNTGFPGNAGSFLLGGYRAARTVAAGSSAIEQTVNTTGKCVRATYPTTIGDIGQYTYGQVVAGAVQTTAAVVNNFTDSTPLTVPASLNPTHNGTSGFTVTPDLVGVLVDPTTNTITYTEDQAVATAPAPVAANFTFTRSGGTQCTGTGTPVVNGNLVTVLFGPVATCPVSDAVRAGQKPGALFAAADPTIPSTADNAIVPASSTSSGTGVTAIPDLVSTTLESNGQAMDFVFDKTVGVTAAGQTAFLAILSNGVQVPSTSASVIATSTTSTTVRVVFGSMSLYNEYIVKGAVNAGAVTESSPPNNPNVFDARPAGDNAGAFARGFTTGADVFNAVINKTTGVVTVGIDQRIFGSNPGVINLLDSTGNAVATAAAGSVTFPTQAAGPEQITIQFSPGQTTTATNLALTAYGALVTAIGEPSIPQILAATSTSSILHSAKLHRAQSKKATRAANAKTRKQEAALRAKFLRKLHHHR
jgi:hypothetical protein